MLSAEKGRDRFKQQCNASSRNLLKQSLFANMPADFASIRALPRDESFAITADFIADQHPNKVSLGAGVYRDESSKPWVLPSVKIVRAT